MMPNMMFLVPVCGIRLSKFKSLIWLLTYEPIRIPPILSWHHSAVPIKMWNDGSNNWHHISGRTSWYPVHLENIRENVWWNIDKAEIWHSCCRFWFYCIDISFFHKSMFIHSLKLIRRNQISYLIKYLLLLHKYVTDNAANIIAAAKNVLYLALPNM